MRVVFCWLIVAMMLGGCAKPHMVAMDFASGVEISEPEMAPDAWDGHGATLLESSASAIPTAAPTPATISTDAPIARMVIYTANLGLRVAQIEKTREAIEALAQEVGGYIQSSDLNSVTFRLPNARFDATVNQILSMGEVRRRDIQSEDVTSEYFDIGIRLEVAEQSRQRLMKILEEAEKAEDLLKIERDIRRLTEEIESMKGRQRYLRNMTSMATIRVDLEEKVLVPAMNRPRRREALFAWIEAVGLSPTLAEISHDATLKPSWTLGGPAFRLSVDEESEPAPEGFLSLEFDGSTLVATTPEEYRLRVTTHDLRQKSDLELWAKMLRQELEEQRGHDAVTIEPVSLSRKGHEGWAARSEVKFAGEIWRHDVWLARRSADPKTLVVIEYARPKDETDPYLARVEQSVKGIRVR